MMEDSSTDEERLRQWIAMGDSHSLSSSPDSNGVPKSNGNYDQMELYSEDSDTTPPDNSDEPIPTYACLVRPPDTSSSSVSYDGDRIRGPKGYILLETAALTGSEDDEKAAEED